MKDLKTALDNHAILIGSRAWGGETSTSDYDYILDTITLNELLRLFDIHELKYDNIGGASDDRNNHKMYNELNIKIVMDGVTYNLMSYNPMDICKIESINEAMMKLMDTDIGDMCAADKKVRIKVVECFFDIMFNDTTVKETPSVIKNNNVNIEMDLGRIFK